MRQRRVVIFGGKGTAINIAEQIEDARLRYGYPMAVIGFAIDDPSLGYEIAGFPVVCGVREAWTKYRDTDAEFLFALYRPDVMRERLRLVRGLGIPENRFANFIHPTAYLSPSVSLGHGNVILSHSCLLHGVSLGNLNIINSHVVIEHETSFQDGSFVAASACIGARVRVGTGTFVGLNATVREDVAIADYAFVGMASGVVHSIDEGAVVYGVPARPKR
jgi:sugar O-acyltransferase (sialic acid O-acetyltransferase NeuD family)